MGALSPCEFEASRVRTRHLEPNVGLGRIWALVCGFGQSPEMPPPGPTRAMNTHVPLILSGPISFIVVDDQIEYDHQ